MFEVRGTGRSIRANCGGRTTKQFLRVRWEGNFDTFTWHVLNTYRHHPIEYYRAWCPCGQLVAFEGTPAHCQARTLIRPHSARRTPPARIRVSVLDKGPNGQGSTTEELTRFCKWYLKSPPVNRSQTMNKSSSSVENRRSSYVCEDYGLKINSQR